MNILTVNLLFSTLVFWLAARLYLLPKLPALRPRVVPPPMLLLHAFRHSRRVTAHTTCLTHPASDCETA
jgi:hypothetical protein